MYLVSVREQVLSTLLHTFHFSFPSPSLGHQDMVLGLWQIKLGCGGHGSLPSKKKKKEESKEPSLRPPNSRLVMPEILLHTGWAEITSALIPLKLLRSILPTFNQSMHWALITGSGLWVSGLGKFSQWAILTFSLTKLLLDQKAVKKHYSFLRKKLILHRDSVHMYLCVIEIYLQNNTYPYNICCMMVFSILFSLTFKKVFYVSHDQPHSSHDLL